VSDSDSEINRFPDRLLEMIDGESVRGFSRKSGVSEAVLRSYLKGDTSPSLERVAVLASAGGVSVEWLTAGVRQNIGKEDIESKMKWIPNHTSDPVEQPEGEVVLGMDRDWVLSQGLDPESLVSVLIMDDAMAPTLLEQSVVLVDITKKGETKNGVYLFRIDGQWAPRRLESLLGGEIKISADNPAYSEQMISESMLSKVERLGRVVFLLAKV
jgi:hypothetical protein